MTTTPYQPSLPVEGPFTEAELNFMEESPPGLFPENQDSNLGFIIRKLFSDKITEISDQLTFIYNERFVSTATDLLSDWESEVGLPIAPAGRTTEQRRADILTRLQKGPFTRERVWKILERFLLATQGDAIQLTPAGVPLVAGGTPLYGETSPVGTLFRVYEDIRNFAYAVWIKNTTTPDIASITRELQRITPAGISFTIDNTRANILNYHRTILNKQPVAYFRLNGADATDESGYANNGTFPGGNPAAVAGPGLLHANVQHDLAGNGDGAADFTTQYLQAPDHVLYDGFPSFSAEAWIRPDAIPSAGTTGFIVYKGLPFQVRQNEFGSLDFYVFNNDTAAYRGRRSSVLTVGTTYHMVIVKRLTQLEIWLNGVRADVSELGTTPVPEILLADTSPLRIGGTGTAGQYFNGVIDEVAVYNYALSEAQILDNYNTGQNIA